MEKCIHAHAHLSRPQSPSLHLVRRARSLRAVVRVGTSGWAQAEGMALACLLGKGNALVGLRSREDIEKLEKSLGWLEKCVTKIEGWRKV